VAWSAEVPSAAAALGRPAQGAAAPNLIVVFVVDQMRADYIATYGHQWTSGLKRLIEEGAWFRQAAYPYVDTLTCAGHATIATGSFPARHGMIENTWWDRQHGTLVNCADDSATPSVGYTAPVANGYSIHRLLLPTLTDELRAQSPSPPRIVSLSLKPRSAIIMAGRRADLVLWFENRGTWASSTAYGDKPIPFVHDFVTRNPVERELAGVWTRALPAEAYLYDDVGPGEAPGPPRSASFPHILRGATPESSYELWTKSPLADAYLGRLASEAVRSLQLGQGPRTDFLHISFSSLDLVGHDFGPWSHEVQDVLLGLDRTIGGLLDDLDRLVGRDDYVVALTADHGVSPTPESAVAQGFDAGRILTREMAKHVDADIAAVLGPGKYVSAWRFTDLYFEPGVYDRLRANPAALDAALEAVRAIPGVLTVLRGDDLERNHVGSGAWDRAARLSYYPGRSGDLIVLPKPYWLMTATAATHGSPHQYDARVPVVLFGARIKQGQYWQAATPADIAPTLAFLAGVTLADPDGRVLSEALESN
jgi:predicted AlkP superfamily pyrophosphatase or phosphodiesterase